MPVIDLGSVVGPQGQQGVAGATGAQGIQGNPGPNQVTNQTSTNLNGVLFGNQSRVAVKPVDSTPTADSTNLVSSGGTDKAIKGRVPVYGLGKNLLRNWYFVGGGTGHGVFPVNQRGQSSYSDGTYVFDGWSRSSYATLSLSENGAGLSIKSGGTVATIYQTLEDKAPLGQNITMAVLTSIGLIVQTGQVPSTLPSSNTSILTIGSSDTGYRMRAYLRPAGNIYVEINAYTEYTIRAVKLELGIEQTLCHNEGTADAPVWVLNEIPDYGEELRKCQRYLLVLKSESGQPLIGTGIAISGTIAQIVIPTPITMSAVPTISFSGGVKLNHGAVFGDSSPSITSVQGASLSANSVSVGVVVSSGLTSGEPCSISLRSDNPQLIMSCEL